MKQLLRNLLLLSVSQVCWGETYSGKYEWVFYPIERKLETSDELTKVLEIEVPNDNPQRIAHVSHVGVKGQVWGLDFENDEMIVLSADYSKRNDRSIFANLVIDKKKQTFYRTSYEPSVEGAKRYILSFGPMIRQ